MSCWPPSAHNEKPSEYGVNGNDFSNGISPNEMFISSIYTAEKCWWSEFQKFCFIWFICFWVSRGFSPHNAKGFIDSRLSGQLCTHAISKTLSQKVITYHWDQATIGNGSLFSHKNTQHTALATVTLDCIVLQSIFGLRHLCAKTDIKYRKSVFRNCPKEYPLIFMIDFKIIGHRLSWTTVDGWFTYLFFVILSDACFTLHMNKLNHPINPHRPKCPKIRSANNILMVFVFFREGRTQSAFDHEK